MRTLTKSRPAPTTSPATSLAYVERVNLAIDHVVNHLDKPLRLKAVSKSAMLSPFHFHRVFQSLVGVTLADFVKRLRLERALVMMTHHRKPSLTSIALACGFSSPSDFTRCFKHRYGSAPSSFDLKGWQISHAAELEAIVSGSPQRLHLDQSPPPLSPPAFTVRIRELPARTVAYTRVHDPYKPDAVVQAVHRMLAWADAHGLSGGQWLGYQWENPELVPLEHCRYHVAVEAERFTAKGEIGRFRFPPMLVAQVEVKGGIDLELRVLQWLYGTWLPRSGYVPDDHPCFESWIGRPFAHGYEYFELNAQLPVRRG
ncbi:MAG: AraC family transcriptional regulator [Planctomycetota bacterium]